MTGQNKSTLLPSNYVRVCVDRYRNDDIAGVIYSRSLPDGFQFENMAGLLLQIDTLMDRQRGPQAFQKKRTFRREEQNIKEKNPISPESEHVAAGKSDEGDARPENRSRYGIYDIIIQSRKHTSMQGFVKDKYGRVRGEFESELRLVQILMEQVKSAAHVIS